MKSSAIQVRCEVCCRVTVVVRTGASECDRFSRVIHADEGRLDVADVGCVQNDGVVPRILAVAGDVFWEA